ncbi:hypothetical protein [Williamsia sp. M5A3_1d]
MGGDYVELGVSDQGSFGTPGPPPPGFHGGNIGFTADVDGFDTGNDAAVDFYTPDTPEERWSIGINGDAGSYSSLAGGTGTLYLSGTSLADTTAGSALSTTFTALVGGQLKVVQVHRFNSDSKGYTTVITLTNMTSAVLTRVEYMRSFDPDNTRLLGGSNITDNTIVAQGGDDGYSLVTATSLSGDSYNQLTGQPIVAYYYSRDGRSEVYTGGFKNTDPYSFDSLDQAKGYSTREDNAIGILFNIGDIAPGASTSFEYVTGASGATADVVVEASKVLAAAGVSPPSGATKHYAEGPLKFIIDYLQAAGVSADVIEYAWDIADAIKDGFTARSAKPIFDRLSTVEKSNAFKYFSDVADGKITPPLAPKDAAFWAKTGLKGLSLVGSVAGLYLAYEESSKAKSDSEVLHAGVSTVAAAAPLTGLAIGFVIGGPVGAAAGLALGGAIGIGLTLANEGTRFFGY